MQNCTALIPGYTYTMSETLIERHSPYPGVREAKITPAKGALERRNIFDRVSVIRKGVSPQLFVRTAKTIGLPHTELAKKLGLAPRTMAARLANPKQKLKPEETEKILRIKEIFEQAVRVFGSKEEARRWLLSPAHGLEGQRPIDLMDTEPGSAQVREYLGAIEYGNYW
jgi:putative toxin-antitoxin system antitoxin component (TIGR02293 family)